MDFDLLRWKKASPPEQFDIEIEGHPVTIVVRVNARARALRLSVNARGQPVLTLPRPGHWPNAERFVARHKAWLGTILARRRSIYALEPNGKIPIRGIDHTIVTKEELRGLVTLGRNEDGIGQIAVPGGPDHFRRRLIDWLKKEARTDLDARTAIHAERLGVKVSALRIRDQSTRWGSCSSAKVLNFNWRLVMAPPFVLDYVAAHEVAHILEMNHQPAYWRTLARTLPDYARGRDWLKSNGPALMSL